MLVAARLLDLVVLLFCIGVIIFMIRRSLKGKTPKIKRLAALEAVDELVARSAEMGQPMLVTPGWGRRFDEPEQAPQFMAFLSMLSVLARKAYEAGVRLICHVAIPEMVPLSQEVLSEAAKIAGAPQLYDENTSVRFFPAAYALAASTMVIYQTDEKPATQVMVGPLMMEALYIANAAAAAGALQIGGTASIAQIPYLVACCDYVLIGEEIYAAGAYLSKAPLELGSIAGQDIVKIAVIVALFAGFILAQFRLV